MSIANTVFFLLVIGFCVEGALDTCICQLVTQKQVFEKADVVGKFKIDKRVQTNDQVIYDATFEHAYKPAGVGNNSTRKLITPLLPNKCGVPALIVGQEYLLAGKRVVSSDLELQITKCESFPPRLIGRSHGFLLWSEVDSRLLKKLESGNFNGLRK